MKNRNENMRLEALRATEGKYTHYLSFKRKDNTVRNIEIIVASAIVFMVATGIYQIL